MLLEPIRQNMLKLDTNMLHHGCELFWEEGIDIDWFDNIFIAKAQKHSNRYEESSMNNHFWHLNSESIINKLYHKVITFILKVFNCGGVN